MKKFLALILALVCAFAVAFTVACAEGSGDGGTNNNDQTGDNNQPGGNTEDETPDDGGDDVEHECTYSTSWVYNDLTHYHASTCAQHPNNKKDEAIHNFETLDGACVDCGKPSPAKFIVGNKFPDFTVDTYESSYKDGTFSSADARGKVFVINFWYVSCGVCIDEMWIVEELNETYGDDIVVLALHKDNAEQANAQTYIDMPDSNHNKVAWTNYKTIFGKDFTGDKLFNSFDMPGKDNPASVVLDQNGVIINITYGSVLEFDMETHVYTNSLTPIIDAALAK